jgi:hypothetical protein
MEPPVYNFPIADTSLAIYKGDGMVHLAATAASPTGKVVKVNGATARGVPATGVPISLVTGAGLVGFAYAALSSNPPFPTTGGASAAPQVYSGALLLTTPAAVTANDPIPDTEKLAIVICLSDCIFYGHEGNNATDITAPARIPDQAAATASSVGGISRFALSHTASANQEPCYVDTSVHGTGNAIVQVLDWAYPQIAQARSTTAGADPGAFRGGASGTTNPAVEFILVGGAWNPTA